ncbi:transglutaminase domain-containing protein [Flavobacterium sharifuzzamanii]|uniref:transglutaminase domain-containing protein n=1 Tax=Flavobacterium sharifuzzamanii TaxID=2211133 RepID=UPI000DADB855|nr:transglutaminase domain-containing protein [Flavobacterium sharifuzzamanii]KAF2081583.1 transglutaminase [Flavobacterium sharifuzzamanii]
MLIKKTVFAFLLNLIFISSSYSQQYSAIDSIVLKYPDFGSTEKLAERIKNDFTTEHDKARAIYSWIALNIEYDLETFLDPPKPKEISKSDSDWAKQLQLQNAKTTQKAFRSRKAVCEGFSQLYQHLALLTGLKCQVIHGDAKVELTDIGRRNYILKHAWNSVQVDGKWILVDVTWGQGSYDSRRKIVVKKFTPIYFDMDPKYFNAKHYAESAMYKGNTGNKAEFLNGPLIYNDFIEENCEVLMPFSGVVNANDGDEITFKIKNLTRIDDLYYLGKKDEKIKVKNSKVEDGVMEFQLTYEKKLGRFIEFYLFGKSFAAFKVIPK